MFTKANKTIDAVRRAARHVPVYHSTVPRIRPALKIATLAILAAVCLADLGLSAAHAAPAQSGTDRLLILAQQSGQPSGPGDRPGRPPAAAVDACAQQSSGSACSFAGPEGQSISGKCSSPEASIPLACAPANRPMQG